MFKVIGCSCIARVVSFIALLAIIFNLSACGGDCRKFDEIKYFIEREIKVGDSRERADSLLKIAGVDYGYDEYQNRYQSTIHDSACGKWVDLSIYVSFDKFGNVSKAEAFRSYTGL